MKPNPQKSYFPEIVPQVSPSEIVEASRKFLGLRFQHLGRGVYSQGIDCAGLLVRIADSLGLPWADHPATYSVWPNNNEIIEVMRMSMIEDHEKKPLLGSAVVFCVPGYHVEGREPQHLAIITEADKFKILHAYNGRSIRKVVEHGPPVGWVDQITHVFNFQGVTR